MSFPCVLTNPLHQHLSHGEECVQKKERKKRARNRPKNTFSFFLFLHYICQFFTLRLHTCRPFKALNILWMGVTKFVNICMWCSRSKCCWWERWCFRFIFYFHHQGLYGSLLKSQKSTCIFATSFFTNPPTSLGHPLWCAGYATQNN